MEDDPANGNCIQFFLDQKTAYEARAVCAQNGGHLVHIKDEDYNSWVGGFQRTRPNWTFPGRVVKNGVSRMW